jgi:hypothetical protein
VIPGVFELFLFSCVTVMSPFDGGDLVRKTCRWSTTGALYHTSERCSEDGNAKIGTPIFSDVYEDRKVEKTKCERRFVTY